MYDTHSDILDAFRAGPDVISGLLANCTLEQARLARGGDEGWSIVEVMCHLRDAEERALERTRAMASEVNPAMAGYDQDAWARDRDYASEDLAPALAAFRRFRAEHVAVLEALRPADWSRPGRHSEMGTITIESHAVHMAAHDLSHAAQIARQLGLVSG